MNYESLGVIYKLFQKLKLKSSITAVLLILFSNIALIVSTSAVSGASTPNAQSVSSVSVQTISSSNFNAPYGIAINSSGDIFVTNTGNSTIAVIAKSSGTIFGQHIDTKQVNTPVILNVGRARTISGPMLASASVLADRCRSIRATASAHRLTCRDGEDVSGELG
jgi:hypothetical protein